MRFISAILLSVLAASVFAAPKAVRTTTTQGVSSGQNEMGIGFSTYLGGGSSILGGPAVGTPALSGLVELNDKMSAQVLFGIGGTDPFQFAVGGCFDTSLSEIKR